MLPESVVVPDDVVRLADPERPLTAPPVEVTAPVRLPLRSVPPLSVTALRFCARPSRSTVAPVATVVAEDCAKASAAFAVSVPPLTWVAPV